MLLVATCILQLQAAEGEKEFIPLFFSSSIEKETRGVSRGMWNWLWNKTSK